MMKKYDIHLLLTGIFLSLFPIHHIVGWLYICFYYPELSHSDTVALFNDKILFNLFSGRYSSLLFTLFCGLIAGVLLLISLVYSLHNNGNKTLKTIKVVFLVINAFFTGWVLWGLM